MAAKPDAAALLKKHATEPPTRCLTCREPYFSLLDSLLDEAIRTGQPVTVGQLHSILIAETGYGQAHNTLVNHLTTHHLAKYRKLNVGHRGPLDE